MIQEEIVSFSLNSDVNIPSLVQFGIQDSSLFSGEIAKIDLNKRNNQWWTFKIKGFEYGSTNIYGSGMKFAIIDSGTSLLTIPLTDYNNFKQQVINANTTLNCNSYNQPSYCFSKTLSCSTFTPYLQPLVIRLDHVTFTIPPAAYAVDNMLGNACTIAVSYSSND
jgi:hypothetical protein